MKDDYKIILSERDIPDKWYNIQPDLPEPLPPPLKPDGTPIGPQDLAPIFPMELIKQEVSQERWIEIPDEIRTRLDALRPPPKLFPHEMQKTAREIREET